MTPDQAPDGELRRLITLDAESRGRTVSRLGYFCAPFRPAEGPLTDKVIKVYQGLRDTRALDRLASAHDAYVEVLHRHGVTLPATHFRLLDMHGRRIPVIVQDALADDSMMRLRMLHDALPATLGHMEAAGQVIATFWREARHDPRRVGFHPSIRNFALIDGRAVFLDTFPPLIGYSRAEMGQMLIDFSSSRWIALAGRVARGTLTSIQDEWYDPAETVVGLVGSACRLRPSDAAAYLDWGRDFALRAMPGDAAAIHQGLARPPRLPGWWTSFRRLLGLQGAPNITRS
jgi:hypothetical protein